MALDEFSIPSCVKDAIKEAGYTANTSMEGFISTWWQWYTGTTQWYDEGYTTVEGRKKTRRRMSIRPARRVCREWASLILNEGTTITCEGAKAAKWLDWFLDASNFWVNGQSLVEKSMALGTGAWALWFDVRGYTETAMKIRRYDARMVVPLSWDEEGITECAFCTSVSLKGKRAYQLQLYVLDEGTYHIKTKLFMDGREVDAERHGVLPDFDTLIDLPPFGIIKPAIENTCVDLSPYGMSVFADGVDAIKAVDLTFDALCNEIDLTEAMVFMSDEMIDVRDDKGRMVPVAPRGPKGRFFRKIAGQTGKDFFEVFSPDIRVTPLKEAFGVALAELGDLCGFGQNYFVLDKGGGLKTATEVSSDNSALMRNIRKHENVVRAAIDDVMRAALLCAQLHCGAKLGKVGLVSIGFDDSIITDTQAEKSMALAEIAALGVPRLKVQYLMKYYGMSEEDAVAAVPAEQIVDIGF